MITTTGLATKRLADQMNSNIDQVRWFYSYTHLHMTTSHITYLPPQTLVASLLKSFAPFYHLIVFLILLSLQPRESFCVWVLAQIKRLKPGQSLPYDISYLTTLYGSTRCVFVLVVFVLNLATITFIFIFHIIQRLVWLRDIIYQALCTLPHESCFHTITMTFVIMPFSIYQVVNICHRHTFVTLFDMVLTVGEKSGPYSIACVVRNWMMRCTTPSGRHWGCRYSILCSCEKISL